MVVTLERVISSLWFGWLKAPAIFLLLAEECLPALFSAGCCAGELCDFAPRSWLPADPVLQLVAFPAQHLKVGQHAGGPGMAIDQVMDLKVFWRSAFFTQVPRLLQLGRAQIPPVL